MSLTGVAKIVQIHPTRQCNLRCQHCYSSSAPDVHDKLDAGMLMGALRDLKQEGYSVVSFSGGEPLLYPELKTLLQYAQSVGYVTTVTTNGMLLTKQKLGELGNNTNLLAISLDGTPASHNRMRAHPKAFETMRSRLPALRKAGIPFGFIFTLTQYNLDELDSVAEFAAAEGAGLLQIHPLEAIGRAITQLGGASPDGVEASIAFLEAARLQDRYEDQLRIQIDLSHRQSLRSHPDKVYATDDWSDKTLLSDLISPLVIETDGSVVPLQYGFSRRFALGNLHQHPVRQLTKAWKSQTLPAFRQLCQQVHEEQTDTDAGRPIFNWYDEIRVASAQAGVLESAIG